MNDDVLKKLCGVLAQLCGTAEVERDDLLREDLGFFLELDLIPRYIGGAEVYEHGIIDDMINAIPKQLSNAEQRAWCQARVNEIFHLHDGKHTDNEEVTT